MGLLGLSAALPAAADPIEVTSPDGRLVVTLDDADGAPRYQVSFNESEVIGESRLGLRFANGADIDADLAFGAAMRGQVDESWEQPWGERRIVRDHFNELAVPLRSTGSDPIATLRIRVFDDGFGFRYELPDAGSRVLIDELTEFAIDPEAMSWWTPAGEFNRYEYIYKTTKVRDLYRVHTPLTVRLEDGVHLAFHEAALEDSGAVWLDGRRPGMLEVDLAPMYDGALARIEGEWKSSWRTVQVADDAVGLINGADMILSLNEPNALGDVSYVRPQKYVGIWWGMHINEYTWGSGPKHGATTENTRRYIDFAAEHGFDGVLVEGWNIGWDGDWFNNGDAFSFTRSYDDFDLPGLSAYAAERGVELIGHHETSGNITNYETQMEAAFDLYRENGITAVKTGYVADAGDLKYIGEDGKARYTWHDGQESVRHHIRVLKAAHERGIGINAHEPVKDTGLRRTYPNAMTREGARGMEFNAWGTPPNPPEHEPILAFTRMLAGPMDFTPGIFDLMPNGEDDINRVQTTLAKQLALYVVLHSPIQMAADLPENYEARPDAFQFIKDVAIDWEESIALQGEVGDFVVMARQARGGDEWFVGGITDEEARSVDLALDFLDPDTAYLAEIYRDGRRADWDDNPYDITIEDRQVDAGDSLRLRMAPGGGFAIRFVPQAAE
jgi:alpha-glucosidase